MVIVPVVRINLSLVRASVGLIRVDVSLVRFSYALHKTRSFSFQWDYFN